MEEQAQALPASDDVLVHLRNARLAVIDTETTGFDVTKGARAIEFAVVHLWNLEPVAQAATLIDCVDTIPLDAMRVHGITVDMTRRGLDLEDARAMLFSLIVEADAFVFHNAAFDLPFIAAILREGAPEIEGFANVARLVLDRPIIDTLGLARRLRGTGKNGLADLAAAYKVEQETAHRALGDARMTARLLPILAKQAAASFSEPATVREFASMSEEAMRASEARFKRTVNFRRSAGLE